MQHLPGRSRIVLSGHRTTTLYLLNPTKRKIEKVEVDGCAITEGLRCDWLILANDMTSHEEIYVELKGADFHHALDQLRQTITKLSTDRRRLRKRCYVVLTRNPMTGTDVQQMKVRFLNDFNACFTPVRDRAEVQL